MRPRKAPAIEKKIKEVTPEDIRVRVFGKVSEVEDEFIVLEDDTGKIKIQTKERIKKGSIIRVFGRPVQINNNVELISEIIQDMEKINQKLYKRIEALYKEEI